MLAENAEVSAVKWPKLSDFGCIGRNLQVSANRWPKIIRFRLYRPKIFRFRLKSLQAQEQSQEHDEQQQKMLNYMKVDPKIQALIPIVSPNNSYGS